MIGSLIDGRFKVLRSLGEGLCSHVYLAEDQLVEGPEEEHFLQVK